MSRVFAIAELEEGQEGGFAPRGAARQLWGGREREAVIAGAAETGKTWACCSYIDALLWKYPRCQGVMVRKTYSSLIGSALMTYRRVIGPDSPIRPYGGERPSWFDYPNGSRLWIVGMDNPQKALSSERDFFYVNQAEELQLQDWETLSTRCTGRGAVMPYTRLIGDCNPGPPSHWIKTRPSIRLLESRHEDNPTLFTDDGVITEQGKRTLAVLDTLTGVRYLRLRKGMWVQAEGVVYEEWDRARHIISRKKAQEEGWLTAAGALNLDRVKSVLAGVDWGFTNPGVIVVGAVDSDGRLCVVRQVVRTRQTIDWWITTAIQLRDEWGVAKFICDPAEPSYIEQFTRAGLRAVKGFNEIAPGINAVQQRLRGGGDGRERFVILEDSLAERDEGLVEAHAPCCLQDEFEAYCWPKGADGRTVKEVPVDRDNHGMDAARYLVCELDLQPQVGSPAVGGTPGAQSGYSRYAGGGNATRVGGGAVGGRAGGIGNRYR